MEVEEGFLEEVTFALSFGKRNGLLRDREDKERHFSQRKQHERRYKVVEMCDILRSLCVARIYVV